MLVDVLIVVGCLAALVRGRSIGFVRQLCSTIGFFSGLLIGAELEPHAIKLVHSVDARAVVTVVTVLGSALVLLSIGEYLGARVKYRVKAQWLDSFDNGVGSLLSVVSLLLGAWLVASIVSSSSLAALQSDVRSSRIIGQLNRLLPPAPEVIAKLNHLVDPNGFPDVFIGDEPIPRANVSLPALGDLAGVVNADKNSVVRIRGHGCGGVVSGSGFVAGPGLIATNAHVVAGIKHPYVQDSNGSRQATVIWFDPNLDFAVLKTTNLAGPSLKINETTVPQDTPAAVLGYPGGGDFSAKPAVVLDEIDAAGRNIYGGGHTLRNVYEIHADIIPGNSGGPLIGKDGQVIGIVFAESTNYNHVGYALTTDQISQTVKQAAAENQAVGPGRCVE